MVNPLLKGVEVFPIIALAFFSCLDFFKNSDHNTYFKKVRISAWYGIENNLAVSLDSKKKLETSTNKWPFICFKRMLIKKSQTVFLASLIAQLFFSSLTYVTALVSQGKGYTALPQYYYDYPATLITLSLILTLILFLGLAKDEPYSWYYPRYGMKCSKSKQTFFQGFCYLPSFIGRFSIIVFVLSLVVYEVGFYRYFIDLISFSANKEIPETLLFSVSVGIIVFLILFFAGFRLVNKEKIDFDLKRYQDE